MANEGFSKIRNGLNEHVKQGKLCPFDLGIYLFLHMNCDYSTGIYRGNSASVALGFDDAKLKKSVQKSLERLRSAKYINYKSGSGFRGSYDILIDKFEPSFGGRSGYRLNAWKYGDKVIPHYDVEGGRGAEEGRLSGGRGVLNGVNPSESNRITSSQTIQTIQTTQTTTESVVVESLREDDDLEFGDDVSPNPEYQPLPNDAHIVWDLMENVLDQKISDIPPQIYQSMLKDARRLMEIHDFEDVVVAIWVIRSVPAWKTRFLQARHPMRYLMACYDSIVKDDPDNVTIFPGKQLGSSNMKNYERGQYVPRSKVI